mmetsp:Transcript_35628/g.65280  ORF Transcript_35628/g.65280 Transcript_35628/m.65280 type:complete len:374 (-) Transcript_35628:54-1175(-)
MACALSPPNLQVYGQVIALLVILNVLAVPLFISAYLASKRKFLAGVWLSALLVVVLPFLFGWPNAAQHYGLHQLASFCATTVVVGGSMHIVELAAGTAPADAKASLGAWLEYITSPIFPRYGPDEKLLRPAPGAIPRRLMMVLKYHVLCGLTASAINNLGCRPSATWISSTFDSQHWSVMWLSLILDRLITGVAAWTFLEYMFCVGGLAMLLQGKDPIETFRNPIFGTSSIRDLWGKRWNMQWNGLYRRSCFTPLKRLGTGYALASFATFALSAAAHELQAYLSFAGYTLGTMSRFFLLHGLLSFLENMFEQLLHRWLPPRGLELLKGLPHAVKNAYAFFIVAIVTGPLFIDIWFELGFFHDIGDMVFTIECS